MTDRLLTGTGDFLVDEFGDDLVTELTGTITAAAGSYALTGAAAELTVTVSTNAQLMPMGCM